MLCVVPSKVVSTRMDIVPSSVIQWVELEMIARSGWGSYAMRHVSNYA